MKYYKTLQLGLTLDLKLPDNGARYARLSEFIHNVRLLHSVVIRPDGVLIAGERRVEARKQLGWSNIPVTVVDLAKIECGEFAENAIRKDFTPSEIDAIRWVLAPTEKAAAKGRMKESGKG